jgi:hypothetical protein
MNKNVEKFIKDLRHKCKKNDVKLKLINKWAFVEDGVEIGGSFGPNKNSKMYLTCAIGRPDYLSIIVHESCHLDQYLENSVSWKKGDSCDDVFEWLENKSVLKNLNKHINNVQDIEEDCERRAIKKIKEYNLPIDLDIYIKKANSYIWFYKHLQKTRHWPDRFSSPYVIPQVWQNMPNKFQKSYRIIPKRFKKLFNEYVS